MWINRGDPHQEQWISQAGFQKKKTLVFILSPQKEQKKAPGGPSSQMGMRGKQAPNLVLRPLVPGVSNSVLVLPGGVGRAGASAKAAQGTLSTGPKKAPYACYYRA
jgi:hypothetical protein